MNRKNFLKISSLSLAGLLITDFTKARDKKNLLIQMPDAVEMLSDDAYISLQSSDKQKWMYKDVIVELRKLDDRIEVYVQSPTSLLKEVRLSWKYATTNTSSIFGDAWERSYGDIRLGENKCFKKIALVLRCS